MTYRIQSIKLDGYYTDKDLREIRRGMGMSLNIITVPQISPVSGFWGVSGEKIRSGGKQTKGGLNG